MNYSFDYNVDMVFCIDATGSMGGLIDMVKSNALNFYRDVQKMMTNKQKTIAQLRVRVIAFRDYLADGENAMLVTDFFNLPQEESDFEETVRSIHAEGGGDYPEDGLEALAYAIKSDWNKTGTKRRHVIVIWTDASTHDLGYGSSCEYYPKGMPATLKELTEWWGDAGAQENGFMDQNAKRLVLFTPEERSWSDIMDSWDNVAAYPAKAGEGLKEVDYQQILNMLANSIG